jgi:hypothetical protein
VTIVEWIIYTLKDSWNSEIIFSINDFSIRSKLKKSAKSASSVFTLFGAKPQNFSLLFLALAHQHVQHDVEWRAGGRKGNVWQKWLQGPASREQPAQHPISAAAYVRIHWGHAQKARSRRARCQINLAFVAGGGFKLSATNRPLDSSFVSAHTHQRRECTISALSLSLALSVALHLHGDRCFCRRAGRVHETGSSLAALLAADQYAGRPTLCLHAEK